MRLSKCIIIVVLVFNFIFPNLIEAKRANPKVEPVIHNGIKYTADKFSRTLYEKDNGYIEAWDVETGEKFWELEVYEACGVGCYDGLDNWIAITNLEMEEGKLIVENERSEVYEVNLETKEIKKREGEEKDKPLE